MKKPEQIALEVGNIDLHEVPFHVIIHAGTHVIIHAGTKIIYLRTQVMLALNVLRSEE